VTAPVHILVVDDEPDLELLIRQKFRHQIRDGALIFSFANNGLEALAELENGSITDIVLADINMPRMDGLSLLGRIRDLDLPVKVVMVSAYGDMANIRTAMNRGAFDFITKPISFDDLTITIEKTHRELELQRRAAQVQHQLTALQRDLEIASQIQLSMLPSAFPAFPEEEAFELCATMIPAQEVGGDLYDCFILEDGRLGFVLGDVSGKGMGAALFMAITRTMMRATALRGLSPAQCMGTVNRALFPESMPHIFVSLIYGVLELSTGQITLCNAGHNRPYVLRENGSIEEVQSGGRGLAICLKSDFEYSETELTLRPGESLVIFSDGVTEANDEHGEQFDDPRLVTCLEKAHGESPAEIIRDVLRSVAEFSGTVPASDDSTLLVLQYKGKKDLQA